jgi:thiosulfate/3-mercaptopyruvate sulfurtransferase
MSEKPKRQEYEDKHIPGALFFDISECCDKSSPYSKMLPSTEQFELYLSNLGITASTHVIVYVPLKRPGPLASII